MATNQLEALRNRIGEACLRSGRSPSEVTLVGASKRQPQERLEQAYARGLRCFGENRVQEAATKIPTLPANIDWHLIGPLQSNKAGRAVELFSTIHSVDRLKIARAIGRHARARDRTVACFLQVNLGHEESKTGFLDQQILQPATLEALFGIDAIELVGLMAIPPRSSTDDGARSWFRQLRRLRDQIQDSFPLGSALSMGMSADFEVAIEEGATHVRLGSLLFGQRPS